MYYPSLLYRYQQQMWIIDHFETFWEHREAIWCIETQLAEKLLQIWTWKFSKISLEEMFHFYLIYFFHIFIIIIIIIVIIIILFICLFIFKLNSTLDTFADKSLPGKYYRDVDKSDY